MRRQVGIGDLHFGLLYQLEQRGMPKSSQLRFRLIELARHFADRDGDIDTVLSATDAELLAAPWFGRRSLVAFRTYVPFVGGASDA